MSVFMIQPITGIVGAPVWVTRVHNDQARDSLSVRAFGDLELLVDILQLGRIQRTPGLELKDNDPRSRNHC
jgi:hypothetical protein